jgi:hypothetical protein
MCMASCMENAFVTTSRRICSFSLNHTTLEISINITIGSKADPVCHRHHSSEYFVLAKTTQRKFAVTSPCPSR